MAERNGSDHDRSLEIGDSSTAPAEASELLLAYLRDRDVPCPRCDYNLRNLTTTHCPECREELHLQVGVQRVQLHALIAFLIPGMGSGVMLGIMIVMCIIHGLPPREVLGVMAILLMSALLTLPALLNYRWFIGGKASIQWLAASMTWILHIMVFLILLITL